ncbi:MAG: adenylate/guanylate cyclase domain-containing protein [Pseudomonadota bacterium]
MPSWSIDPVVDWLLHKGRYENEPEALLASICTRVQAAGLPIDRVTVFISTLHPQYFGFSLSWQDGATQRVYGEHGALIESPLQNSPMRDIASGQRVIRRRLEDPDCPLDYPILHDLKADGYTDYLIVELVFSSGQRNGVSLATRAPGGFDDHDIQETERILHLFALLMENNTNQGIAANLMDTYLGTISGARVLQGQIKRGDGDQIDAVIWFSDLRESTRLAETLGHERFLALLNDYFEATAGAVLDHGGEVLRFIGDASLAVFPIASVDDTADICARSLEAARDARARVAVINAKRSAESLPGFSYGVGLHRGEVLYGNIGTHNRLEFSVIGPAANETARIEALCKSTGSDVVISESVIQHVGGQTSWPSLGHHALRGVDRAIEIFALP